MFGAIPEVIVGAGAVGVFAFLLLGMVWHILKSQQNLITNHLSELIRSSDKLQFAIERLADRLPDPR